MTWTIKNFPGDKLHYVVDETGRMVASVPMLRRDDAELIAAMPSRIVELETRLLALEAAARAVLEHCVAGPGLGYLRDNDGSRGALAKLAEAVTP